MNSYVTSTDVLNTSLNNTNSPIQIGEISSTTSNLMQDSYKRKNSSSGSLPHKIIKTGHYEESMENNVYRVYDNRYKQKDNRSVE